MFLYSRYKLKKELILRIYDDGSDKRPVPVIVDEENKTSSIESVYENIKDILKASNFIDESIDKIMTVIKEETKTVDVFFKTVNLHEGDIVDITYILDGEIHNIKGSIYKIMETGKRVFRNNKSEISITIDTSDKFQSSLLNLYIDEIRDIDIIERKNVDPFGDSYPEYVEPTPEEPDPEEPSPDTPGGDTEDNKDSETENPDDGKSEENPGSTDSEKEENTEESGSSETNEKDETTDTSNKDDKSSTEESENISSDKEESSDIESNV